VLPVTEVTGAARAEEILGHARAVVDRHAQVDEEAAHGPGVAEVEAGGAHATPPGGASAARNCESAWKRRRKLPRRKLRAWRRWPLRAVALIVRSWISAAALVTAAIQVMTAWGSRGSTGRGHACGASCRDGVEISRGLGGAAGGWRGGPQSPGDAVPTLGELRRGRWIAGGAVPPSTSNSGLARAVLQKLAGRLRGEGEVDAGRSGPAQRRGLLPRVSARSARTRRSASPRWAASTRGRPVLSARVRIEGPEGRRAHAKTAKSAKTLLRNQESTRLPPSKAGEQQGAGAAGRAWRARFCSSVECFIWPRRSRPTRRLCALCGLCVSPSSSSLVMSEARWTSGGGWSDPRRP
jgi:hypothetical protein